MRYQDEPCCGCAVPLNPGADDVVVCPDCGAPMHRACWQSENACPLRERHGAAFAWQPTIVREEAPPDPDDVPLDLRFDPERDTGVICPGCGCNCPPGTNVCPDCGARFSEFAQSLRARFEQENQRREQLMRENFPTYTVHGRDVTMGDEVAGEPMEEIALQLRGTRRSVTHYLERFEDGKKLSWNWAAFLPGLFGPFWFFFRKLYKPGLLFGAVGLIATLAFLPVMGRVSSGLETQYFPAAERMLQCLRDGDAKGAAAAQAESVQGFKDVIWRHRTALSIKAAQILLLAAAQGLLADTLLRRRIWANIARAREDSGEQRYGRHQMLIRMGGISFFSPMAWLWVSYFLPQMIIEFIAKLTG